MLSLLMVESGQGEDVVRSIPVAVDWHEDLLASGVGHLKDQHTEGGVI